MANAGSTERDSRTLALCREIAAELRAAAADADLTAEERRWLVEIALERARVNRR